MKEFIIARLIILWVQLQEAFPLLCMVSGIHCQWCTLCRKISYTTLIFSGANMESQNLIVLQREIHLHQYSGQKK